MRSPMARCPSKGGYNELPVALSIAPSRSYRLRARVHLRHPGLEPTLAERVGVDTRTTGLPPHDLEPLRHTGRVPATRCPQSDPAFQPDLVHRVVEYRSRWGDGCPFHHGSWSTGSPVGRCGGPLPDCDRARGAYAPPFLRGRRRVMADEPTRRGGPWLRPARLRRRAGSCDDFAGWPGSLPVAAWLRWFSQARSISAPSGSFDAGMPLG